MSSFNFLCGNKFDLITPAPLPLYHACLQVESEVQQLLERLHMQSSITPYGSSIIRERDPASVIPQSSNKDKDMLTYITSSASLLQQVSRNATTTIAGAVAAVDRTGPAVIKIHLWGYVAATSLHLVSSYHLTLSPIIQRWTYASKATKTAPHALCRPVLLIPPRPLPSSATQQM